MSDNMSIMAWKIRAEQLIEENESNRDAQLHMQDGTLHISTKEDEVLQKRFGTHSVLPKSKKSSSSWVKQIGQGMVNLFSSNSTPKLLKEYKVTQKKFTEALKDRFGNRFVSQLSQKSIDEKAVTPSSILKTLKEAEQLKREETLAYLKKNAHLFSPNEELFKAFINSEAGKSAIEVYVKEMIYDSSRPVYFDPLNLKEGTIGKAFKIESAKGEIKVMDQAEPQQPSKEDFKNVSDSSLLQKVQESMEASRATMPGAKDYKRGYVDLSAQFDRFLRDKTKELGGKNPLNDYVQSIFKELDEGKETPIFDDLMGRLLKSLEHGTYAKTWKGTFKKVLDLFYDRRVDPGVKNIAVAVKPLLMGHYSILMEHVKNLMKKEDLKKVEESKFKTLQEYISKGYIDIEEHVVKVLKEDPSIDVKAVDLKAVDLDRFSALILKDIFYKEDMKRDNPRFFPSFPKGYFIETLESFRKEEKAPLNPAVQTKINDVKTFLPETDANAFKEIQELFQRADLDIDATVKKSFSRTPEAAEKSTEDFIAAMIEDLKKNGYIQTSWIAWFLKGLALMVDNANKVRRERMTLSEIEERLKDHW